MKSVVLFVSLWGICTAILGSMGIPYFLEMFGGSYVFYFLLPIIVLIIPKHTELSGIVWSIILTLTSIIVINYLYSYYLHNKETMPYFIWAFGVLLLPLGFLNSGIYLTIRYFMIIDKEILPLREDRDILSKFFGFSGMIFYIPIMISLFIGAFLDESINRSVLVYRIALGFFICTSLYYVGRIYQIPTDTLNYVVRLTFRTNKNIGKIKKTIIYATLIIFIFSFLEEIVYRADLVIWVEIMALFLVYLLILWKFGTVIFEPIEKKGMRPSTIYLPKN